MIFGWIFGLDDNKKYEKQKMVEHIAKYGYRLKYVEGRIKLIEAHLEEIKGKLDKCCEVKKGGGGH